MRSTKDMVAYFVWLLLAGHTTSQVAQIVPSLLINPVGLMTRSSVLLSATAVLSTFTSPVALALAWPEAACEWVILGASGCMGFNPPYSLSPKKDFQFHLTCTSFVSHHPSYPHLSFSISHVMNFSPNLSHL